MRDAAMILEVARRPVGPGDDVNVRQIRTRNHRGRGETRLAIQSGVTEGDGGQGLRDIVHVPVRIWSTECRNRKLERWMTAINAFYSKPVQRISSFQFRVSNYGTSTVSASGTISKVAGSWPTS